jgi:PRTRC genetic system protein B
VGLMEDTTMQEAPTARASASRGVVAGYAQALARAWEAGPAILGATLAADPAWRAVDLARRTLDAALDALGPVSRAARSSCDSGIAAAPTEELADAPVLRLTLYEGCAILTSCRDAGGPTHRYVDPGELSAALTVERRINSPFLPPRTVFYAEARGERLVATYEPPTVRQVTCVPAPTGGVGPALVRRFAVPMPGLVVVTGDQRTLRIFAVREEPRGPETPLFAAPVFNLLGGQQVCTGDQPFSHDPRATLHEFFSSRFGHLEQTGQRRSRRHPGDLLRLWEEIAGRDVFPLDDLVPLDATLGDLIG